MDIPVSRLNERMALRLPAQFPLGLVFVVGTVDGLSQASNGDRTSGFYLAESGHRLRCRLSERASRETNLLNGSRIRAGGHLAFDAQKADYYLLARDVEIIPSEEPRSSSLAAIIADYNQRSEQSGLIPAELPDWVRRMAPPEMGLVVEKTAKAVAITAAVEKAGDGDGKTARPPGLLGLGHEVAIAGLSDELIDFLSEAMDSEDEVELTPALVQEYNAQGKLEKKSGAQSAVEGFSDRGQAAPSDSKTKSQPKAKAGSQESLSEASSLTAKKGVNPWIYVLLLLIVILIAAAAYILYFYVI